MNIWELLLTAVAVSMDAFAVAVTVGAVLRRASLLQALKTGAFFGFFQAVMPLLGLWAGQGLHRYLLLLEHWAACGLLVFIGGRMIAEVLRPAPGKPLMDCPLATGKLLLLSLATSMDAMAVGVSLALTENFQAPQGLVIGLVTFLFCTAGVLLGEKLSRFLGNRACLFGGGVLVAIGIKILIDHIGRGV